MQVIGDSKLGRRWFETKLVAKPWLLPYALEETFRGSECILFLLVVLELHSFLPIVTSTYITSSSGRY
jgi:hypothetical protein